MPRPVCAERTDGGSPRTRLAGDRVLLGDMVMVYSAALAGLGLDES